MADRNSKLVYSTGTGAVCPGCGWPAASCTCSRTNATASIPAKITAKLRIEKAGRGGKTVTVVYDLPDNGAFLKDLAGELKRACGVGGSAGAGTVEVQGDQRERVRALLVAKGYNVKG